MSTIRKVSLLSICISQAINDIKIESLFTTTKLNTMHRNRLKIFLMDCKINNLNWFS